MSELDYSIVKKVIDIRDQRDTIMAEGKSYRPENRKKLDELAGQSVKIFESHRAEWDEASLILQGDEAARQRYLNARVES